MSVIDLVNRTSPLANFEPLTFSNPSLPSVTRMTSDQGQVSFPSGGQQWIKVPKSVPSTLSLTVSNVQAESQYSVCIGSITTHITAQQYFSEAQQTVISIEIAAQIENQTSIGGMVVLGANTTCRSQNCLSNLSLCFSLQYYNDHVPYISKVSTSQGSDFGGGQVYVQFMNFPLISGSQLLDASIQPGNIAASVYLVLSNSLTTQIMLTMPKYDLGNANDATVQVKLSLTDHALSFNFAFLYVHTPSEIVSLFPTQGLSTGKEIILIQTKYFPIPLQIDQCLANQSSCLMINFGSYVLNSKSVNGRCTSQDGSFEILSTSDDVTLYLSLCTPAMSGPSVSIVISPAGCYTPCASSLSTQFQILSVKPLEVIPPTTTQGFTGSDFTANLYLRNVPSSLSVANDSTINLTMIRSKEEVKLNVKGDPHFIGTTYIIQYTVPSQTSARQVLIQVVIHLSGQDYKVSFQLNLVSNDQVLLMSLQPSEAAVSSSVAGRTLHYQTQVSMMVSNFPLVDVSQVVVKLGQTNCSGLHLVPNCAQPSLCGNQWRITAMLPPTYIFGNQSLDVFILQHQSLVRKVSTSVRFITPCNFDSFCGSMYPDYIRISQSAPISCENQFCVPGYEVQTAKVDSVNPPQFNLAAAKTIEIAFENFPAISLSDFQISFNSDQIQSQLQNFSMLSGSSITVSQGMIQILLSSNSFTGLLTGTLSLNVGGSEQTLKVQSATFEIEILPKLQGQIKVLKVTPESLRQSDVIQVNLDFENMPMFNSSNLVSAVPSCSINGNAQIQCNPSIQSSSISTTRVWLSAEPPGQWNVGNLSINVSFPYKPWMCSWYGLAGSCKDLISGYLSASLLLRVKKDPSPSISMQYPKQGPEISVQVFVTAQNLPSGLSSSEFNVSSVDQDKGISASIINVASACVGSRCTTYNFIISIARSKFFSGQADFVLDYNLKFSYIFFAIQRPQILSISPDMQYICSGSPKTQTVQAVLSDFPNPSCGLNSNCANESSTLTLSGVVGTILKRSDVNGNLLVDLSIECKHAVNTYSVALSAVGISVNFTYSFIPPPVVLSTCNVPDTGGNLSIGAWGLRDMTGNSVTGLSVAFGELSATKYSLLVAPTSSSNYVNFRLEVPAMGTGVVVGRISTTSFSYPLSFAINVYGTPAITSVSVSQISVDGRTDLSLTGDAAYEMMITVTNLPTTTVDRLKLTLSSHVCNCTIASLCKTRCGITSLSQTSSGTQLYLITPASKSLFGYVYTGPVDLGVQFTGLPSTQRLSLLSSNCGEYTASASTTLMYYTPNPVVLLARFCKMCIRMRGFCIVQGRCADKAVPLDSSISYTALQDVNADNVLEVVIDNLYDWIQSIRVVQGNLKKPAQAVFSFNGFQGQSVSGLSLIKTYDSNRISFQVGVPSSLPIGALVGTVALTSSSSVPTSVPFNLQVVDDRMYLRCIGRGCLASTVQAQPVELVAVALPYVSLESARADLTVTIGGLTATQVTFQSLNATGIYLAVTPPDYTCASCSLQGGSAYVNIIVSSLSDASMSVSASFSYWSAPLLLSAKFESAGNSISLLFDQATDKAGMDPSSTSCAYVLTSLNGLGTSPTCSWITNSNLQILLDQGASIVPGDLVQVKHVRTLNRISQPSASSVTVGIPDNPISPFVQLYGPEKIDSCSQLVISTSTSSARLLTYQWSCLNDNSLNSILSGYPSTQSSLTFNAGSTSMQVGVSYLIAVTVVNFMGVASSPATIRVMRTQAPIPQISFTPSSPLTVQPNQDILVTVSAEFSTCSLAQQNIIFSWTTARNELTKYTSQASSILWIPWSALNSAQTYTFTLTVTQQNSVASTNYTYQVVTAALPLIATISGGSKTSVPGSSMFVLDASGSRDPNLQAGAVQTLQFIWKCTYLTSGAASACAGEDGQAITFPSASKLSVNTSLIGGSTFSPYQFTVDVIKPGFKSASASVTVDVTPPHSPVAQVFPYGDVQMSGSAISIGSTDRLALTGTCDIPASSPSWTLTPSPNAEPSDLSLFPLGWSGLVFVVQGSALAVGVEYNVTLTCSLGALAGEAMMTVKVNAPPSGGSCSVCLQSQCSTFVKKGRPLIDTFVVSCSGWTDVNVPLSYSFGFSIPSSGKTFWFPPSMISSIRMGLPEGSIPVTVIITDSQGTTAQSQIETVQVGWSLRRVLGYSLMDVWKQVKASIEEAMMKGNLFGANQMISAAALLVSSPQDVESAVNFMLETVYGEGSAMLPSESYYSQVLDTVSAVSNIAPSSSNFVISNITTLLADLIKGYQGAIQSGATLQTTEDIYSACLLMKYQLNESGSHLLSYMLDVSDIYAMSLGLFSQSLIQGIQSDFASSLLASSIRADAMSTGGVPKPWVTPIPRASQAELNVKNVTMTLDGNPSVTGQQYFTASQVYVFNQVLYNESLLSRSDLLHTSFYSASWSPVIPKAAVKIRIPIFTSNLYGYEKETFRAQLRCVSVSAQHGWSCLIDTSQVDQGVAICHCNWSTPSRRLLLSTETHSRTALILFAAQDLSLSSCMRLYDCSDGFFLGGCGTKSSSSNQNCKVYYSATQSFECGNIQQASCKKCSSNCSAGFFISQQCTLSEDIGCSPCGAGSFSHNGSVCQDCPQGSFTDLQGQADCMQCSPGYFSDSQASTACRTCPSGTFAASHGSTSCSWCPSGRTSEAGSTSPSDCECLAGHTEVNGTCMACPPGTYKPVSGNGPCSMCPSNFTSTAGSQQVSDCHCDYSRQSCSNCRAGYYQNGTQCVPCPPHSASQPGSWLMSQCWCIEGYQSLSKTGCSACPTGTYKPTAGNEACKTCTHNTTTTAAGQSSCVCTPGYRDESASGKCAACPSGTYAASYGATACQSCPPYSTSDPGSPSAASCRCKPGYLSTPSGCTPCPAATYQNPSTGECTACPARHLSSPGSASLADCYACNDCDRWHYVVGCKAQDLGSCRKCSICSHDQYLVENCTWNTNSMCQNCTLCSKTEYVSTPCSQYTNTICLSCKQESCSQGYYWSGCDGINQGKCVKGYASSFNLHLSTTAQFSYKYQVLFIKAVADTAHVSMSDVILISIQQLRRRASYSYAIEFSIVNYASTFSESKLNDNVKKQAGLTGISNLQALSKGSNTSASASQASASSAVASGNEATKSGSSILIISVAAAGGVFLLSVALYVLYRRRLSLQKPSPTSEIGLQSKHPTDSAAASPAGVQAQAQAQARGEAAAQAERRSAAEAADAAGLPAEAEAKRYVLRSCQLAVR
eukprot:764017-Hanusia_phi.AAC.1